MSYIQEAIRKIKAIDLEEMRALRKNGHRSIRIRLETPEAAKRKKAPASASVPLMWMVDAKERYYNSNEKDEAAFSGFVSDWISGWV